MSVAVIGAGPAGMTAAYQLAKAGVAVDVYEASPYVGGLARSLELWGQIVDLGPHRFFSEDSRVNRLWLEVIGKEYAIVERLTRIYYNGRFYYYPLRPLNALWNLGPLRATACVMSYLDQKMRPARPVADTFEGWVVHRFGRKLFEIFFKNYSEKLWGIPCDQLDSAFAAQRIKKFSLGKAISNALGLSAAKKHKTLVDQFAYPHAGTGSLYARMADAVQQRGGRLFRKTPVASVGVRNARVEGLRLPTGEFRPYEQVISTMPLTLMVLSLPDTPPEVIAAAKSLKFRNTILVYLHIQAAEIFPDQWIYVHSPELRTGRVTNFSNWAPQIQRGKSNTILALEYWCYDDEALWKECDERLIALAADEISRTGLVRRETVIEGHVERLHRCYPVYSVGYRQPLKIIESYLSTISGLWAIGRYGAFKYNNQDHSILMGILAAENAMGVGRHNLWEINTDYENYQERSLITETGLVIST